MRTFKTLAAFKRANRASGRHFFDADAMAFFDSRIESDMINGRYFVTSEQYHGSEGYTEPRRYTVRRANADGGIDSVPEFQAFATLDEAREYAGRLSPGPVPCVWCDCSTWGESGIANVCQPCRDRDNS